jgi:uncharacterized protein YkwD
MKLLFLFIFISFIGFSQSLNTLIIQKVNRYRVQNHLKPLVVSDSAKILNVQQLNYMVETSTVPLDHTQKIKTVYPKTFNDFKDRVNYIYNNQYKYIGENLYGSVYEGDNDEVAETIFKSWVNSPSHNKLLLDPYFTGIFVNYVIDDEFIIGNNVYTGDNYIFCVLTVCQ